jgi:hypothetical protein
MHQTQIQQIKNYRRVASAVTTGLLLLSGITTLSAQAQNHHAQQATAAGQSNQQLMNQIAELRAQVAKLQAAVHQTSPGKKPGANSGMPMGAGEGMGMMADMGEMGGMKQGSGMGMKDDQGEMGGMAAGGDNKMAAPKAMGMCCMGAMGMPPGGAGMSTTAPPPGMAGMSGPSSAMLGQPGPSHLLHIGSTGFFLNHSQHITLTADQKSRLNRLKEKAMLGQASEQRKIDQAEQELYMLTGADQLDNSKVQAKIGEIEQLRAEQRMNFIQAVGEASNVLTHDQHQALMGTMAAHKK